MDDSLNRSQDSNEGLDAWTAFVRLLNKELANTIDLWSQARQAHLNVRGPYDTELRSLFDGLAVELRQCAGLIAHRINKLGGRPVATIRYAARESNLRDYPLEASDSHEHIEALLSAYSRYERDNLYCKKVAQEIGDVETAGLLLAIAASIQRALWFLEAYLEGIAVGFHGRSLPSWTPEFARHSVADNERE